MKRHRLHALLTRISFLFLRRKPAELDEELQFHIDQAIAANIASGMSDSEGRRRARIDFGGLEQSREATRSQHPLWFLDTVAQDARYALRGFLHAPAFTLTVVATLALGIGATTAVFSFVDRILFRSLPYAHDDRLVSIGITHSLEKDEFMVGGFFFDWRDNQRPFEAFAAQSTGSHACSLVSDNPTQLNCASAQAGFLPLLGIAPILGRNFAPEEDRSGGPAVALISYGLWQTRFGRDPQVLNHPVNIDGESTRIIGVLPQGFELPTLQSVDVLTPMAFNEAVDRKPKGSPGKPMRTFARLKPGVSIAQARAEMEPLYQQTAAYLIPPSIRDDFHLSIRSLRDRQTADIQLVAWILLGSVFAVLLIACANVASLMMARGAARERELAVRSALGASRSRLIRQTLTEASLLALAGAVCGLALAEGLLRAFIVLAPTGIPFLDKAHLDLRIAIFTVALALVAAAFFGLAPALHKPAALASRTTHTGRHAFLRRTLVAGQIAISMILLSGAALLLRSFRNMEQQNLGIQTNGILTVSMAMPAFQTSPVGGLENHHGQPQLNLFRQVEGAVRRLPGIRAVGWTESLPPGGGFQDERHLADIWIDGKPSATTGIGGLVRWRGVTPDYFHALAIHIVRGQNFTEDQRESKQEFVILSRLAAVRLFPNSNPIGQHIRMGGSDGFDYTVNGIAENSRNGGLNQPDLPEIDWLRRDVPEAWGTPVPRMIVATDLSTQATSDWIRSQVKRLNPTIPVKIETLNQQVSTLADRPRFETALLGFFALTGLVMAVIGLYGVISYLAAQRTQEIGIRMALGANRIHILRLIAREGTRLILIGSVVGLVSAFALTRLLKSLLFNIGPHDPASFIAVAVLLGLVAILATLVPARKAMQTDPAIALRSE